MAAAALAVLPLLADLLRALRALSAVPWLCSSSNRRISTASLQHAGCTWGRGWRYRVPHSRISALKRSQQ